MLKFEARPQASLFWRYASPLLALLITVALGIGLFVLLGKDPVRGLQIFFWEPLKSAYALGELMVKATPLLLIALGLAVCYRSNVWNIGAEGQFVMGAVAAGGVQCPAGSFCAGGASPARQCACPGLCSAPGLSLEVTTPLATVWSVSTIAGAGPGGAAVNGVGTNARFNGPYSAAVAPSGSYIVADTQNSLLRSVTPGGSVAPWCGVAPPPFASSDGTCATAVFYYPSSLVFDPLGNAVVTDIFGSRVRRVTPAGVVSTIAGGTSGYADGVPGQFRQPTGASLDALGRIYLADVNSHTIRVVYGNGTVATLVLPLFGWGLLRLRRRAGQS
jgi:hypothetical protein